MLWRRSFSSLLFLSFCLPPVMHATLSLSLSLSPVADMTVCGLCWGVHSCVAACVFVCGLSLSVSGTHTPQTHKHTVTNTLSFCAHTPVSPDAADSEKRAFEARISLQEECREARGRQDREEIGHQKGPEMSVCCPVPVLCSVTLFVYTCWQ